MVCPSCTKIERLIEYFTYVTKFYSISIQLSYFHSVFLCLRFFNWASTTKNHAYKFKFKNKDRIQSTETIIIMISLPYSLDTVITITIGSQ